MRICWVLIATVGFLFTGCYRVVKLPPPLVPPPLVPNVLTSGSPGPGLSRVILDSSDGPALVEQVSGGRVTAVAGTTSFGGSLTVSSRLCTTPCVVDVAPGPYELRFTLLGDPNRTSTGFINVDQRSSVYRHAIGRKENNAWKGYVGWPLLVLGVLLDAALVQKLAEPADDNEFTNEPTTGRLIGMGALSLGITTLGGWLVWEGTVVDQPGSGLQWHF
jgi:hypothetical protein